jgi:hypothetical protein
LVYFAPFLVDCVKKNLATLLQRKEARPQFNGSYILILQRRTALFAKKITQPPTFSKKICSDDHDMYFYLPHTLYFLIKKIL